MLAPPSMVSGNWQDHISEKLGKQLGNDFVLNLTLIQFSHCISYYRSTPTLPPLITDV